MKGTEQEPIFKGLFIGQKENVIKCTDVHYESSSEETFYVLPVHLQKSATIEEALKTLFQAEELVGENQYNHDEHGKQNAKKFMRMKKPPPILQVNINRFGFGRDGSMRKINSRCDFG